MTNEAERRRTPAMVRALDRTLSIEERRAALEEASGAGERHAHPGQGWHSHPGPRFHEHKAKP